MSLFDRIKLWYMAHPFAPITAGLILLISAGFSWIFYNEMSANYTDHAGTVCCLSSSYFVVSERAPPLKMMVVDLDNGRKVEVPVMYKEFFVPYSPNKRVLVRQVKSKSGSHPRFIAVRYLND